MKIPVFISCATTLTDDQNKIRKVILELLEDLNMEPRALGRSDYPKDYPLKEVAIIAKRCSGGIILGFEQIRVTQGKNKVGTPVEKNIDSTMLMPTAWNHIEAGILFAFKLPMIIFKEEGINGGIFDNGVSNAFVHILPKSIDSDKKIELKQIIQKWFAEVSIRYNKY